MRKPLLLRTWDALIGRRTSDSYQPKRPITLSVLPLEDRMVLSRPLPAPYIFVAPTTNIHGSPPLVDAYYADTGTLAFQIQPFDSGYTGGLSIATGDINHDGTPDLITAATAGGGPAVKIFDGKTGDMLAGPLGSFYAYDPSFTGGVYLASGNVLGDGYDSVITAAGAGGAPHIKVFDSQTGNLADSFYAFAPSFEGGATIAAADFTGDGRDDLVVGAGPGGGPEVKIFDLATGNPIDGSLGSFYAFDPSFTGGVNVGTSRLTGDVNGDGRADVVVGQGPGGQSEVRVFDGATGSMIRDFFPFGSNVTVGVTVSTAFVNDDSYADIVVGSMEGIPGQVKVFDGQTSTELATPMSPYSPFGADYTGGLSVAASNDPDMVTITLNATPSPATGGSGLTLTAQVSDFTTGNGYQNPTGTVTFQAINYPNMATLGAVTLANSGTGISLATLTIASLTLTAATYTLQAQYSGDSWFLSGNTSKPLRVNAGSPPPPPPPPVGVPIITGITADTGISNSDGLTSSTTPSIFGTAPASSTVAVTVRNPVTGVSTVIGSTTASVGGLWTLTYSGTALGDGTDQLTATATSSGVTSVPSAAYLVTVDTVAPLVTIGLDSTSSGSSLEPSLRVTGADLNGLATTAVLDIDPNNSGTFTQVGAQTVTLKNGTAVFASYPLLTVGTTARFRARLLDAAGNQGTSSIINFTPTAVSTPWVPTAEISSTNSDFGKPDANSLLTEGDVAVSLNPALGVTTSSDGTQSNQFVYNSQTASAKAVVNVSLPSANNLPVAPSQILATLLWDGSVAATQTYSASSLPPGEIWHLAMSPTTGLTTGEHTYTVQLSIGYTGPYTSVTTSITSSMFVVDNSASALGAGWTFSNIDKLVPIAALGSLPAGILRELGSGGYQFYTQLGGGGYQSPAGDAGSLVTLVGGGYRYTSSTGTTEAFNSSGLMTGWSSRDGNELFTYTYDGSSRLTGMVAPDGGVVTFSYPGSNVLVQSPNGRTTTLSLSGGNDLVTMTSPAGALSSLSYTTHLLSTEQVGTMTTQWGYNNGRVATVQSGSTATQTISGANTLGMTTLSAGARAGVFVDELGNTTSALFNVLGQTTAQTNSTGGITWIARNANGFVTGITNPLGQTTNRVLDSLGNPTRVTLPNGGITSYTYTGAYDDLTQVVNALGQTVSATYDASGHLLTSTDALGRVTSYTYAANGLLSTITDPLGRVTSYLYDSSRRLIRTLSGGVSSGTTVYDAAGDPIAQIDALGNTTTSLYDQSGRLYAQTTPIGATSTTIYDASGLVVGTVDANGVRTSYQYDGNGRQTVMTTGVGTSSAATTTSIYDNAGNLIAQIAPTGVVTSYLYDGNGNLVQQMDSTGQKSRTAYNLAGQAVNSIDSLGRVSTTIYDLNGNAIASVDPLGNTSTTVYDSLNRVIATIDPLGNRSTTVYDSNGHVIATIDPLGRINTTVYDSAGQAVARIDALGRTSTTIYDSNGRVSATIDPLGNTSTTVYDADGQQVATIDPLGRTSTTVYDNSGNVIATVDPLGNRNTTIYDSTGKVIATVDALGNTSTRVYDTLGRQIGQIDPLGNHTTTILDNAGRTLANVDALGNTTSIIYDSFNRQVATVDALGNRTTTLYDGRPLGQELSSTSYPSSDTVTTVDPLGYKSSSTTDADGRTVTSVDALGNTTTTLYDAAGRTIATIDALGNRNTAVYDAAGQVIARIDPLGHTTSYLYDLAGERTVTIDALGNRTTTAYDLDGRVVATTNALGNTNTTVYDAVGQVVSTIDPLGRRVTNLYDADGRRTATIDALGHTSTTVYDNVGHVIATVDTLGNRTTTAYDADGRAFSQTDALGRTTTTIYDGDGNVTQTINALGGISTTIYDANNNAIFHLDPLARTSQTVYDADGRAIAQVDPLSNRTTTVYNANGNVIATIDPLGHPTTRAYDALNRVISVTNSIGGVTSYLYDADGNQTVVINPNGRSTSSVFDADQRVVQTIDPLGKVTSTAYDAIGETTSITDPTGRQNAFSYDADGELTQEKWYSSTGTLTATLTFTYDANGNKLTAAAPAGTYTFAYDALNRVSVVQGPNGTTQTNSYDAVGNKTVVQDSFGGTVTTSYDALYRITAVVQGGTGVTAMQDTRAYDAASQLTSEARLTASGSTWTTIGLSTFAYDTDGRVTGETSTNGSGTVLVSYAYAYDAASRITRQIDNGALRTYSYDSASQVTGDTGTGAAYTYDSNGNRTMTGYAVNAANEITSDGTWTYAYDAAGNEISKTNISSGAYWSYTYNNWNQMTEAMEKSSVSGTVLYDVVYGYDAFGNVISRTMSGVTTDYAYTITDMADGYTVNVNTLWAELTSGGSLTTRYLVVDGQDVARSTSSAAYWLLTDREGSIRNITNNTGAIVDSITYTAFGGIQSETNSSVGGNLLYTGAWLDRTTGLYQMHWRSYDPATGQWVSVDPLGFGGGDVNTRRYVGNDATNNNDLNGLWQAPGVVRPPVVRTTPGGITTGRGLPSVVAPGVNIPAPPGYGEPYVRVGDNPSNPTMPNGRPALDNFIPLPPPLPSRPIDPRLYEINWSAKYYNTDAEMKLRHDFFFKEYNRLNKYPKPLSEEEVLYLDTILKAPPKQDQKRGKGCFVAGTKLLTVSGYRNIEEIQVGEYVFSRDQWDVNGAVEQKVVEEIFTEFAGIFEITVCNQLIRTTVEHPFFVVGRGWMPANELTAGDRLACADGTSVSVDKVTDIGSWVTVYNIRVADHHTYFVGCDEWGFSVWAHNACVTLYHEQGGDYPEQMRHWAIYVESKAENLYGDMANDKKHLQPMKDRMNLDVWIAWGKDNKVNAWFRTFSSPKDGGKMIASKPMEITEEVAARAIKKMKELADAESVRWSLDGDSCFEFVAKVLRVAKPDLGLPASPNGSEKQREKLLEALRSIMNET